MKKRVSVWVAAALLLAAMLPAAVFGASASASISGGGTVKAGDSVTVTVTYRGESLGYVNGQLFYDNNKLQYVSGGSSEGDAGLVELKNYADNASGKMSFHLKFKAVDVGVVKLSLETLETQNLDGDQDMGAPSASSTVTVTAAEEETTEETTTEPTEETTAAATSAPDTETVDWNAQEQTESDSGMGMLLPILGIIAAIIIILAIILIVKLRGRR